MTDSRIDRRGLLARVAGALAVGLAGCSGPDAYNGGTDTPASTDSATPTPTESPTATATTTESPTPEPTTRSPTETRTSEAPADASNPVGNGTNATAPGDRTNRTRNGSNATAPRNRTGNVTAPGNRTADATTPRNRTGNATAPGNATRNGTGGTRPPRNGSTNASAPRNRTGNATNRNGTLTSRPTRIAVRVRYPGDWSGSIETDVSSRTISGAGRDTVRLENSPSVVLANVRKLEKNRRRLTVEILKNGRVVAKSSTRRPNGRVSATHSF